MRTLLWPLLAALCAAEAPSADEAGVDWARTGGALDALDELLAMDISEMADSPPSDASLVGLDDTVDSIQNLGSGVYYEFDTSYSEVVRTGQAEGKPILPGFSWVNANSPLPLASASKLYTGFAAMRTMQLRPDEFYPEKKVKDFEGWENFGNFKVFGTKERADLTIYHLLTHTSGLPFCLDCTKEQLETDELFYWPGTNFGYTVGHRVMGWLLRDFWGYKTVQDTFDMLVFKPLGLSPNTKFSNDFDTVFGDGVEAGDATIQSSGEDLIRLAVVAVRKGSLPSGEQLVSEANWNKWAIPNLLPDGKLSGKLVAWQSSSPGFTSQLSLVGQANRALAAKIMKQSGAYGWNFLGATYFGSTEIGWCGFFSSCMRVSYPQNIAFVMMQRDVADLKKSKPYVVNNFDLMARQLQCADTSCDADAQARQETVYCERWFDGRMVEEQWRSSSCPHMSKQGKTQADISVGSSHHACYKPHCDKEKCVKETPGRCRFPGCPSSLGLTVCQDTHCKCAPGYCFQGGRCQPSAMCRKDTGGTCLHFGCDASRGSTYCSAHGRCLCQEGYCEADGQCERQDPVIDETCIGPVGSCNLLPCYSSRGPTDCVGGHCVCKQGSCPVDGKCVPRARLSGGLVLGTNATLEHAVSYTDTVARGRFELLAVATLAALAALAATALRPCRLRRAGAGDMSERLLSGA